jgi:predicted dehydrogenase
MKFEFPAKPRPVVKPGDFVFAAAFLEHNHINDMCKYLIEAGATLGWIYDTDAKKAEELQKKFPAAKLARTFDELLAQKDVRLIAAAAIPCERGPIGCRVMEAGKDYFTDKTPFTTLDQLNQARAVVARTGRKYMVYYSERLKVECAMYAGDLIRAGAIGRVVQMIGTGPHRLSKSKRPDWFFEKHKFGGILCDIGSHQCEQFLHYTGATDATVTQAMVANFANADKPEFEDFGEASLLGDNGASGYIRCDWFTPDGLRTWGDGRTVLLGTKGYIELRKYIDVAREASGEQLYLVDDSGEYYINVAGKVGFRFFGELILDCLERTEHAMTQAHAFKAAELCLRAQAQAQRIGALR